MDFKEVSDKGGSFHKKIHFLFGNSTNQTENTYDVIKPNQTQSAIFFCLVAILLVYKKWMLLAMRVICGAKDINIAPVFSLTRRTMQV